ncbi:T9SS type A sorting domain-containing protein [Dyadobacter sp. LJ419]|uniref:T9SS type A sorting domain-containing protein n=1 Tax=Dyadobacter chenwenxiniae TaxID=2906456 RepID=A0A9X1PP27_9BACT|nr:T9SS type A sorting domain-containing protein [Dyadobacter chenwenxiniae]MCF0064306.1 T9SS type A sorting domain-containing protein [Dyadobacter chenwenxiniae]
MEKTIAKKHSSIFGNALLAIALLFSTFAATAQNNWNFPSAETFEQLADVAYGNGKYVQIGSNGLIRTSTNRVVWETLQSGIDNYSLNSIVFANGKFVIVGQDGTILTSSDGSVWNKQNSGTDQSLNGIAFGNGVFVAVGINGTIVSSPDGNNWTGRPSGTTTDLNDVAFSAIFFVAVGNGGEIRTSKFDNLDIWTQRASGTTNTLVAVADGLGATFVAVGAKGTIVFTSNAYNWQVKAGPANSAKFYWMGVAANPVTGAFVAINDGYMVATSADGSYWGNALIHSGSDGVTLRLRYLQNHFLATGVNGRMRASYDNGKTWSSPVPNYARMNMKGAAFGNGRFVAVGNEPLITGAGSAGYSNLIINSTDGIHFSPSETSHLVGGAKTFNDVTFGNSMFVAVGDDAIIQTSTDGIKWNYSHVIFGKKLTGVAYGNGRFVAVGYDGLILWSVDGKTWQKANSAGTISYNAVGFTNGQFTLVGREGVLASSVTGINWNFRPTGTKNELRSVAYGNGRWIAVGTYNTVVTSLNGSTWKSQQFSPSNDHFDDICYANGQFVAVTMSGNVYTSISPNFWDNVTNYKTNKVLNSITFGNGQFFAVGISGLLMTSPFAEAPVLSDPPKAMRCSGCLNSDEEVEKVSENEVDFNVTTFPNPVVDHFAVVIQGAAGEEVRLTLMDLSGRTISDKTMHAGSAKFQESITMVQKQTGMYLLRVSTHTQMQTVKIFKQ